MSKEKPVFCVVGAGHGGMSMAAHLSLLGFEVRLYNRTPEHLEAIRAAGGIDVSGEVDGFARIPLATDDATEAVSGADVIMIAVPATGHRFVAESLAPCLADNQYVVLNPGRTFGAIEFQHVLKKEGCKADVTIAEAQTFLYACRGTGPAEVRIFRIKNSVPLATLKAYRIPECLHLVRKAFPQFVAGDNVFKTSFNNIGAIFHPAIVLLNAGWIDDMTDFEFYHQGASESVCRVLDKLDAERIAVAAALGIHAMTSREWLYFAYDVTGRTLQDSIRGNPGYRGILAPHLTEMRYITEDVPCSLVPMSSIGRQFGVPTPVMDSLITMASAMHDRDYRAEGRTVDKMGIDKLSLQELRLLGIGEYKGGTAQNEAKTDAR